MVILWRIIIKEQAIKVMKIYDIMISHFSLLLHWFYWDLLLDLVDKSQLYTYTALCLVLCDFWLG